MYPKECKAEAVVLAEKRETPIIQVARDWGINDTVLHRWMQLARETAGTGLPPFPRHGRPRDEELVWLWNAGKALGRANEMLTKATVSFAQGPPHGDGFMGAHRDRYTVGEMAGLLGVSRSA